MKKHPDPLELRRQNDLDFEMWVEFGRPVVVFIAIQVVGWTLLAWLVW